MATGANKSAGLGMTLQEPESLTEPDDGKQFTLSEVDKDDKMFKEIEYDFKNADLTVLKVEKLQNNHLWKRYVTERDQVMEQRKKLDDGFQLNEKYLYHGTSVLKEDICEQGLDSRMSKEGCFGKGIYFSDYPRKCVKYAERETNKGAGKGESKDHFILLTRVILGETKEYKKGEKDKQLVREPEKNVPYKGHRFYDSVKGVPVNHTEFVVYESRRVLVEGIITYKRQPRPVRSESITLSVAGNGETADDVSTCGEPCISGAFPDTDSSDTESDLSDDEPMNIDDDNESSDDEAPLDADRSEEDSDDENNLEEDFNFEEYLLKKRDEFKEKSGVTDEHVIDHCLLKANLDVDLAVTIHENMSSENNENEEENTENEEPLPAEFRHEYRSANQATFGTDAWNNLSEADKEVAIEALIDDFVFITGDFDDSRTYAKKYLEASEMDLDVAILAYYEEI